MQGEACWDVRRSAFGVVLERGGTTRGAWRDRSPAPAGATLRPVVETPGGYVGQTAFAVAFRPATFFRCAVATITLVRLFD